MRIELSAVAVAVVCLALAPAEGKEKIKALLLAGGPIHDAKGCAKSIEKQLDKEKGLEVTCMLDDLTALVPEKLKRYDVIILYYSRGTLTAEQEKNLLDWLAGGKGFVGLHLASGAFAGSNDYREMIGGSFRTHPPLREFSQKVVDRKHPITKGLPPEFKMTDEQYLLKYEPDKVHVLIEGPYEYQDKTSGKTETGVAPSVWTKPWQQGRVVYISWGHSPELCDGEIFGEVLRRATVWAARGK